MDWLTDRVKIDLFADPVGGVTSVRYTPYYDMLGYESIDFVVSAAIAGASNGTTAKQNISAQMYKATGATGGGSTAISSATGVVGKTATAITTVVKGKALELTFSTVFTHANFGATITVLGKEFISATANSAALYFCGLSCAAATVAAESFITAFNTNASLTAWKAEIGQSSTGLARVFIRPSAETAVPATYHVSAGGASFCGVGVPCVGMHFAAKIEHLKDHRYVALGFSQLGASLVPSTIIHYQPVAITVLRTKAGGTPVVSTGSEIAVSNRIKATQL